MEPRRIQDYTADEKRELDIRIDRAMKQCPERYKLKLLWLKADCQRHLGSLVTADKHYKEAADLILQGGTIDSGDVEKIRILIEAATVAKSVPTESQLKRAISYLRAVEETDVAPLRVLGMMTEIFALLGEKNRYEEYLSRVTRYRDAHSAELSRSILEALEDALDRAKTHLDRRQNTRRV